MQNHHVIDAIIVRPEAKRKKTTMSAPPCDDARVHWLSHATPNLVQIAVAGCSGGCDESGSHHWHHSAAQATKLPMHLDCSALTPHHRKIPESRGESSLQDSRKPLHREHRHAECDDARPTDTRRRLAKNGRGTRCTFSENKRMSCMPSMRQDFSASAMFFH